MMETVIITDSCSDLPLDYVKKRNIPIINYTYTLDGKEYPDDFGQTLSYKDFYDAVRVGSMPTTSQVNTQIFYDMFEEYVKTGKAVIYISFSSGLTGSVDNAYIAKNMILEKYPDADLTIVDTLAASLGEGLLVYYAVEMLHDGATKEEIVNWLEDNKLKLNHWFTVDDIDHLHRGGRLSGATAFVANIMDIKPVLNIDDNGHLVPIHKARGRKKALKMLIDKFEKYAIEPEKQVIAVSHGDALEDAQFVANTIKEKFNVKDILINPIGPTIGSHSGPGTIALFFFGEKRFMQ